MQMPPKKPETHLLAFGMMEFFDTHDADYSFYSQVFALDCSEEPRKTHLLNSFGKDLESFLSTFNSRGNAVVNGIMYIFGNGPSSAIFKLESCILEKISAKLTSTIFLGGTNNVIFKNGGRAVAFENGSKGSFNLICFYIIHL